MYRLYRFSGPLWTFKFVCVCHESIIHVDLDGCFVKTYVRYVMLYVSITCNIIDTFTRLPSPLRTQSGCTCVFIARKHPRMTTATSSTRYSYHNTAQWAVYSVTQCRYRNLWKSKLPITVLSSLFFYCRDWMSCPIIFLRQQKTSCHHNKIKFIIHLKKFYWFFR